ncbi:MAG: lipoate--protein ligase family protein [Acidobacteria bacterium]|nr:lipoate--protein ligase family protein [Acidobacteriota bacterium]
MTQPWRLLINGADAGAANMARDMAILEHVCIGQAQPTLRLYSWSPPCLTLGRHQPLDAADEGFCHHAGIEIARRPTGGRAVLHHLELTYAVIAPLSPPTLPTNLQAAYRKLCSGLVRACHALGISAELTPGEVNLQLPGPRTSVPCFKAPAGGEVVVSGRKLIGSAMRRHGNAILQHGAFLLDWDSDLQAGAVGLPDDSSLRPFVTTVAAELGLVPSDSELTGALATGVAEELGVTFQPGELTAGEQRMARELIPTFTISG